MCVSFISTLFYAPISTDMCSSFFADKYICVNVINGSGAQKFSNIIEDTVGLIDEPNVSYN